MIRAWLSGHLVQLLLAALVGALALAGWQWAQATAARAEVDRAGRQFAEYRETQERQHAQALEQLRADRNRADKARQEALDAEHLSRLAAQADADRLRAGNGQLQRYSQDLATSLGDQTGRAATSGSCEAAEERIGRLAIVVGALDDFAAEAVAAADHARLRGQLCERTYDALSP